MTEQLPTFDDMRERAQAPAESRNTVRTTVLQNAVLIALVIYAASTVFRWAVNPLAPAHFESVVSGIMAIVAVIGLIQVAGFRVKGVTGAVTWLSVLAIAAFLVLGVLNIIY